MTEENTKIQATPVAPASATPTEAPTSAAPATAPAPASAPAPKKFGGGKKFGDKKFGGDRRRNPRGKGGRRPQREPQEFDQTLVQLARVTRVTKGGKRLRFRALLVIGDRKGRVGYGVAKGADVQIAVSKAFRQAKKKVIKVPIVNETIAFPLEAKFSAARILLKPAPKGSGIIAGGALRTVLEYAGVPNISAKILGTNNKISNVKAAFKALEELSLFSNKK